MYAPKSSCSSLAEKVWTEPVPDAPAPVAGETPLDTLKNWINFGVAQTANKQTEFERSQAKFQLIQRCEERDREAIDDASPKGLLGLRN